MITEDSFLQAILARPADDDTWLVLADWLEENGQPERSELVRLQVELRREHRVRTRARLGERARQLMAAGVRPCVPAVTNSLGMTLVLVPPGLFLMGTPSRQSSDPDERPRRVVEITRPFFLGAHHVTQRQFELVMRRNPCYFGPRGPGASLVGNFDRERFPAETVSYLDVERFLQRLSDRATEKKAGRVYRLPTEAEWEYACRAGVNHTFYHFGKVLTPRDARFDAPHPLPVGSFPPNLFGIHDMHGNAWEWCADWYQSDYYAYGPRKDPTGPATGGRRVLRGGAWSSPVDLCRSALRGHNAVHARHNYNGFRVAVSLEAE